MAPLTAMGSARYADRRARGDPATLLLAAAVAVALAACHASARLTPSSAAIKGQALGKVVDSVVIPPFARGDGVQINAADLDLFRQQLEEQLTAHPGLKAYPAPPTTLANTVTLNGTLAAFEVHEQTGDGMFLRTIDMILNLSVRVGADKDAALKVSRAYSYQKLYRKIQGAAALEYDLHNAAREATGTFAATLAPGKAEPLDLQAAVDTGSGSDYSLPLLTRGNREARYGRYDKAIAAWSLLLYNPAAGPREERYRVSGRTLARLASDGATPAQLDALKPLAGRGAESLADFRERVAAVLGPNSPLEPKVLELSDENTLRARLNLACAHYNLGAVYSQQRRYDLAAYHLSRADAYDPTPRFLAAWLRVQARREVLPEDLKPDDPDARVWVQAYQRVPAPFTATVVPGTDERNVVPGNPFPSAGAPAQPLPAPVSPAASPSAQQGPPVVAPASAAGSAEISYLQASSAPQPRAYGQPAPPGAAMPKEDR